VSAGTTGSGPRLVTDVVDHGRRRFSGAPAIVSTQATWTYDELGDRMDAVAAELARMGVAPGAHVAHIMENTVQGVAAFFGVLRAGAVLVPLNTRLSAGDIAYEISRAEVTTAVVSSSLVGLLAEVDRAATSLRRVVVVAPDGSGPALPPAVSDLESHTLDVRRCQGTPPPLAGVADDVAIMWFTSGTTGRPKPTEHTHRGTLAVMGSWARVWGLGPADRIVLQNQYHVATVCYLGGPLTVGAASVLAGPFSLENRLREMEQLEVTAEINGIVLLALLDHHPEVLGKYSLSPLRKLGWGGAPMDSAMLRRTVDRFPQVRDWYQCWAQTESGGGGTCLSGEEFFTQPNSIGRALDCVDDVAVHHAPGAPDGPDDPGELILRGPTVMRGYFRDAAATAQTVRDGWLFTGDLATVNTAGFIRLHGRSRDTIKRGGENVLPFDIERVICEFPGVAECVVVGLGDSVMGEVPVAFVVARDGRTLDQALLESRVRQDLADFKRPAHIRYLENLPRNANGKIVKAALVESVAHLAR
jgi:acyl-CoA synthetase (AMP-forming)/AMP-acid ligase II